MNKMDASALRQFDELPASAYVRLPVVTALLGASTATIWRWSDDITLPKPVRINGITLWNVGALRAHMPVRKTATAPASDAPSADHRPNG